MPFKEHGLMLYLALELYTGFIRLQAEKGLGRSYAGLLPFTEGLFRLGYISQEVYEKYVKKYSEKLVKTKPLTLEQKAEQNLIQEKQRLYSDVLKQWGTLKESAKKHHIETAREWADKVPNAKLVLDLANDERTSPKLAEKMEASR